MSIRKNPLSLVSVVVHALAVIVGVYAILTLWKWVPSFKSLFGEDLMTCEKFPKLILFVFVPIGIALFCSQIVFNDSMLFKVLTGIGLAVMVVPALIFHFQLIDVISKGEFIDFCTKHEYSVNQEYFGLLLIFPVICLYLVMTFQLIGKDQYVIHENYDDALDNAGFILPYVYICFGNAALMLFIGKMGSLSFFSIFTLVVGFIALAVMGISRLKNGSPFEY